MKVCVCCKIEKSIIDFHKDTTRKDNLNIYCKECRKEKLKRSQTKHKQRIQEYYKEYYKEHKDEYLKRSKDQYIRNKFKSISLFK